MRVENDVEEEKTKITLTDRGKVDEALALLPKEFKQDATSVIETYGYFNHTALLQAVSEKYPAYARKSRLKRNGRPTR